MEIVNLYLDLWTVGFGCSLFTPYPRFPQPLSFLPSPFPRAKKRKETEQEGLTTAELGAGGDPYHSHLGTSIHAFSKYPKTVRFMEYCLIQNKYS